MTIHYLTPNKKSVSLGHGSSHVCISLSSFPKLYKDYFDKTSYKLTHCVECMGEKVADPGINMSPTRVYTFVYIVCQWGGVTRVFGCLPHRNGGEKQAMQKVVSKVKAAVSHLNESTPNTKCALEKLRTISGFKGISCPSKILRMLAPDKAVTLDSRLQIAIKSQLTPSINELDSSHYAKWCEDCVDMAKTLPKNNALRPSGIWKAADVEAVIYDAVRAKQISMGVHIP